MKDIRINSPIKGTLIPLNEVNDPVFGGGAMGQEKFILLSTAKLPCFSRQGTQ